MSFVQRCLIHCVASCHLVILATGVHEPQSKSSDVPSGGQEDSDSRRVNIASEPVLLFLCFSSKHSLKFGHEDKISAELRLPKSPEARPEPLQVRARSHTLKRNSPIRSPSYKDRTTIFLACGTFPCQPELKLQARRPAPRAESSAAP